MISQAFIKDTVSQADPDSLWGRAGRGIGILFMSNHPRWFWSIQFSLWTVGVSALLLGHGLAAKPWPEPINLPLLCGLKARTSNTRLRILSTTTEPWLSVLQRGTCWQVRKPQVKECQKHHYWTRSLSHHAFLTNLMVSTFAVETVQKEWRM